MQDVAQTEWMTVYKIAPHQGSRLDYTLNIIDTSCFGDTSTVDRWDSIEDQVRYLFKSKGDEGLLFLDSVCFIVKAPMPVLHQQRIMFLVQLCPFLGKTSLRISAH